jgi:hypothetical protein
MTVKDSTIAHGAVHDDSPHPHRRGPEAVRGLNALRSVSGTVAAALLLLAVVVVVAAVMAGDRPGPGMGSIVGHAAVALAALALQVLADRRRGPIAVLAALLVFPLAAATLWFWWWN